MPDDVVPGLAIVYGLSFDAFDISEQAVAEARRLAQDHGLSVNYAVADVKAATKQRVAKAWVTTAHRVEEGSFLSRLML